jgi:hypothetical protein
MITEHDQRDQFLQAYLRHRLREQLEHHQVAGTRYSSAHGWTVTLSTILFAVSALLAGLGIADDAQRPMWAFLATTAAALGCAVAGYAAAFGFRRLSRQHANTVATLRLLATHGPTAPDVATSAGAHRLASFVRDVETALLHDVGPWTQVTGHAATDAVPNTAAGPAPVADGSVTHP